MGVLEWLGDVGGLLGALSALGKFFSAPFAKFFLKSEFLSSIYRRAKIKQQNRTDFVWTPLKHEKFKHRAGFWSPLWKLFFTRCFDHKEAYKEWKLLDRAEKAVN